MNKDTCVLSIIIPTYNHEKYIKQAIESVKMQIVDFEYEVLVGEDCSSDSTKSILQELERTCDNRFKFYYRKVNCRYNKTEFPYGNSGDLKLKSRGKYIITLEGDDYWTDRYKLQKQVDFLNNNVDYYACAHQCIIVDECSKENGENYPSSPKFDYEIRYLASDIMPGQTASFMYRNPFTVYSEEDLDFLLNERYYVGDRRNVFYAATKGKIACFKEVMSAYRHIVSNSTSFSANNTHDFAKELPHYCSFLDYCNTYNITGEPKRVAEFILYCFLFKALLRKKIGIPEFLSLRKKIERNTAL